jgi:hypothetical protein
MLKGKLTFQNVLLCCVLLRWGGGGQGFLCMPNRSAEQNARERVNTAMTIVVKGVVTAKQIEEEFTRILPSVWRWTARRIADNMFTMTFPNALLINEWACFNPISMRQVKARILLVRWGLSFLIMISI